MSQSLLLRLKGLWTALNEYSEIPDGALAVAENIVIDKDSIGESRRGFSSIFNVPNSSGGSPQYVDRISEFDNNLIVHYGESLAYWNGTTLYPFTGTYNHPSPSTLMRFAQQNENLYFTTSNGIYKLDSLSNEPVPAGIPAALDLQITANTSTGSGFLGAQSSVAYRVVWGFQDANNNLLLGAPSQRATLDNASTTASENTSCTFTIPQGITVNHFYQVYRSDQIAFSGTTPNVPDDNMQLVYEGNPTNAQLSAKSVSITDITPDSLRGAALYTNATQQGILQQNTIPPFANDICAFKNCLFFANTSTAQNITVTLLAAGGTGGVQVGDTLTVGSNVFTAISTVPTAGSNNYQVSTAGSPAQNVAQTAVNLVAAINQSTTNTTVYAYYLSGATDLPGKILLQNRSQNASSFAVTASAHGSAWNPILPTSGSTVSSTSTPLLNGLMYSVQQEPESVPSLNVFYPGSASYPILRILPLRDSLFILKADGVFRLSGTSPQNFAIDTLDNTVFLTVPESAVPLNNCVYALTTQGVVQIMDTGISIISRPIEDQLNSIVGTVGTALQQKCFGVAYESDRKYLLFLPVDSTDASATICYCYNYLTQTWVTWDREQLSGYVFSVDNKLYLGNTLANSVSQERKDYAYTDYTDEALNVSISAFSGTTVTLVDTSQVSVGDILYQSSAVTAQVTAVNIGLNTVTVADTLTWATGSTQLLKSIACSIQWLPNTGYNPGYFKQYSEGLLLFRAAPFLNASISYLSDISPSFSAVPVTGFSPLGWGFFPWGGVLWGGVVRPATIRHYIPLAQQKCTLLTPLFQCQSGWSNFQLEGLSLSFRPISTRTTR